MDPLSNQAYIHIHINSMCVSSVFQPPSFGYTIRLNGFTFYSQDDGLLKRLTPPGVGGGSRDLEGARHR